MSDTPDEPLDPPASGADAAVETEVFAEEAALDAAETKRRVWFMRMIRRERRREKVAKDRSTLINSFVTIGTTVIVAGTAMYATLKTSSDGRLEERRGARVDALVEHWSSTIADASTAIELLGQRSNDLWAYGTAIAEQGVVLDEALGNEADREKKYLEVRSNLAATTARAGLVSSVPTLQCLDKFIGLLDTWQNALNWTRSTLQVEESLGDGIKAVNLQLEKRSSLNDGLTIVRTLARAELAKAGEANEKCNIPEVDAIWAEIVPVAEEGTTEEGTTEEEAVTEDTLVEG
ncbi:MAG: hypothetical protein ACK49M_00465 [Actinomycetes bacterium]